MCLRYLNPLIGRYRRHRGYYDEITARCFYYGWKITRASNQLLTYAMFRRDMGERLPARWIKPLTDALPTLTAVQRRFALGLLAERAPDSLAELPLDILADGQCLPAVAAICTNNVGPNTVSGKIHQEQDAWRSEFARDLIVASANGGVAVIGNSAKLLNSGRGHEIDDYQMVIRFNYFMGASAPVCDVGRKTDVWVVAPGYNGPFPESVNRIIVTGPDMRYRMADWKRFLPLLDKGVHLLTVPLEVWRALVRQLEAPPSAGVLTLSWLRTLNGCWDGLASAGIGAGIAKGRYHATLKHHAPSQRHAWGGEADIVRAWRSAGLRDCFESSEGRR